MNIYYMHDIERQLNKLPKQRLSSVATIKIFFRMIVRIFANKFLSLGRMSLVPIAAVFLLLCLVIGIPGYAYASQGVVEGHYLYGLKRSMEEVELSLSFSSTAKIKTYEKIAERRLAEAEFLSDQVEGEEMETSLIANAVNEVVKINNKIEEELEFIKEPDNISEIKNLIEVSKEDQIETLSSVARKVGIQTEEQVVDAIAVVMDEIKKVNKIKININKRVVDTDGDGLSNRRELELGTDPNNVDTDGDGYHDDVEVVTGHNPLEVFKVEKKEVNNKEIGNWKSRIENNSKEIRNLELKINDNEVTNNKSENLKFGVKDEKAASSSLSSVFGKKNEKSQITKNSLEKLKKSITELKKDITDNDFEEEDVETLFHRLKQKVNKAEEEIKEDDLESAESVIKTSESLKNNAKHFIKTKKIDKIQKSNTKNKNDEEDSVEATSTEEEIEKDSVDNSKKNEEISGGEESSSNGNLKSSKGNSKSKKNK